MITYIWEKEPLNAAEPRRGIVGAREALTGCLLRVHIISLYINTVDALLVKSLNQGRMRAGGRMIL